MMKKIQPGSDGMPPIKDQYDNNEKALIVAAAEKLGVKPVADMYEMKWQYIASWKKYYGSHDTNSEAASDTTQKNIKRKTPDKNKKVNFIIQSAMGGEITPEEILKKVGDVDKVYVRVDENKAYWVKNKKTGSVNLW